MAHRQTADPAATGPAGWAGATENTLVSYCIDADDVVVDTGLDWDGFARENDAPELCSLRTDRTLWSYIADDATREVWQRLVQRARTGGEPITVRFRCDAPNWRRWFTVTLTGEADGRVEFIARMVAEEEQPTVVLLDERVPRDPRTPMVRVCAWCGRCLDDGQWIGIDRFMQRHEALGQSTAPPITHAICPSCEEAVMGVI